ncbi:MAG: nuclear transport factor 2 family protein [Dehalococcoidia bacterium]
MAGRKNVEVVMRLYGAFGRGDMPGILALLDGEVDWEFYGPKTIPFAGRYSGRDGMERFFRTVAESAEVEAFGPEEEPIAAGDKVVVQGHERVRAKTTGRTFETHWIHVFTLRNGKIVKLREYYDTAAMQAAFV